ncbi:MAG: hypothetical protein WKF45_01440 [Ilumatobacteraceae bacterium]
MALRTASTPATSAFGRVTPPADRLEPDRINVFEQWETVADVEAFRGSGPSDDQSAAIRDAAVDQHEIASTTRL